MLLAQGLTSFTGKGMAVFVPWIAEEYKYSIGQINLGSNPNSKIEIVSALNSFNLAIDQYYYRYINCTEKYNPKVYFGAIHTAANRWNNDVQKPGSNAAADPEKSGSWPQYFMLII